MRKLEIPGLGLTFTASGLVRAALILGLLFMLGASLPGQMSYDSLAQLHEGRFAVRETWGPAIYGWLLGVFDEIVPGTGLYVVASALLLFLSLSSLRQLRPDISWWAPPVTVLLVFSPLVLIYQGVVWKDVLFANLAIASFACLAHAPRFWDRPGPRWLVLIGAMVLLATAALVRQNGLVAVLMAAIVLGVLRRREGWGRALTWAVGGLVATLVLAQVLAVIAQPKSAGEDKAGGIGVRIVQHYDLIGAMAHDPTYRLSRIEQANPAAAAAMRRGVAVYSPERVDFFDRDPTLGPNIWPMPNELVGAEWRDLITKHPKTYLAQRADVFRWLFLTPKLERCLPVFVGVEGPEPLVSSLKLTSGRDPADVSLANYATYFYGTPVFSHLAYALIALAVTVFLLWRRDEADYAIAGLMLSALGFTASFFVISIACDYRYLYFLDLAAMAGLFYLALDPSLRRSSDTDPRSIPA
ncbi:MAG: hypothetical protein B7Y78_00625 [Caulobacter sp. 35-67-4]|nr:MAG: hypothetical protein B7Y81_19010 [Caulobacter sp. 32-67-35]OYX99121.1 MAG: hypothetical protein B7Y78_00625 [Caulobacter sp. 35-67-4]HQR88112.1 DUF2142 domain-containing protein [Caulobacter sp.]